MDKKNNSNNLEITPEDALIDGLSFITQKLYGFFDGKDFLTFDEYIKKRIDSY